MFGTTGSKEVTEFAIELAETYARLCPLNRNQSDQFVTRTVNDLCQRAADFQARSKLGFYRRAKFGTEFKLRLKELGFPTAVIDDLTAKLLLRFAGK